MIALNGLLQIFEKRFVPLTATPSPGPRGNNAWPLKKFV
jgi:hypothetical protein